MEEEFPKKPSSESGTRHGFSVEARISDYADPMDVGGQLITNKWKTMRFEQGSFGVPIGAAWDIREYQSFGLMSYQAAQAMRWWMHAQVEAMSFISGLSLESRLVQHDIEYSRKATPVSAHEHIHGEDRSNCIPGWVTKAPPGVACPPKPEETVA